MEPWTWILVYLVGFTLFQLLLFRYFSDDQSFEGMSVGSGETAGVQSVDRGQAPPEATMRAQTTDDGVRCPHCGTHNEDEQNYMFCRNCVAQLH